jgi:hypothetical protein
MLHDRIARALPHWGVETTGFHAVLGMMAFGLEETGRYGRAEAIGRYCVEIQPLDGWGVATPGRPSCVTSLPPEPR